MTELLDVTISNGEVTFFAAIPGQPATSEVKGNITINNSATVGRPAHYEVSFMISSEIKGVELSKHNAFHWTTFVAQTSDTLPYREIETIGAKQVAASLRELAEKVEAAVAGFQPA